ncbi:MAG: ABC transporter permease, partial [Acidobacteria bacterium]|nr:ABC transporter permease [Acidobacteriota bacterium]
MSFELKIAWRYARARRKSLARFTSFVAVVGIAAGAGSLIVAQSLARGFADEMRDKILANTAHVMVFSKDETEISDWRAVKEKIETLENVREVSPTTYANAVVISETATIYAILRVQSQSNAECRMRNAELKTEGKKLATENQTENPHSAIRIPQSEVSLGARLAEKLNLKTGDGAEIATFENQGAPQRTFFRVKEVFQTGLYEYDSTWIYISPENFARLAGRSEFMPTILSVSVKDIYRANE